MTREEILEKYPVNQHNKTETMDEDQCTVDDKDHVQPMSTTEHMP